ncbi:putative glycoside hydrolase family 12 protein [Neofusicoccum parvum UCRNP2]|uniref:Glutathione-dependent formaldehyde-activating family GFA n=2 Tax=Neofusicoccum parvum TaxID=310453 RepID=A0ACB5S7W0_9PEZI|nr:putative glycoside hydrolase family 12 protein [Neofusicoccum parvum UCRNP2]GME28824.1 Glutathione-dependent formaldehyde-activating family GFA [Neofusicoccum parvum]
MKFSTALLWATTAAFASAAPSAAPLERRADFCGDWDNVKNGPYTTYNNLWGRSTSGVSGSQCTGVDSFNSNTISWHTSWSWSGVSNQVKSYANVVVDITSKQLSAISSINSIWKWSYTGSGIVANVAYDLFTSSSATGSEEYEIMIWVAALGGAGPISATGSPIATVTLAGSSWKLYKGKNSQLTVFSFVAASNINNFSGNLNDFIKYLTSSQGLPASQYLKSIGAGTEPFVGSNAKLTTSSYTVSYK